LGWNEIGETGMKLIISTFFIYKDDYFLMRKLFLKLIEEKDI